jgi:hypothetical protein
LPQRVTEGRVGTERQQQLGYLDRLFIARPASRIAPVRQIRIEIADSRKLLGTTIPSIPENFKQA